MEEVLKYLNSIYPLSDKLIYHFSTIIKPREILKKQYILKAGHTCQHIYYIQKGLLRCFYLKDNTEVCSWFMKEGDVFISVESFLKQKPSYEYIQAIEDSMLYYIDYRDLQYIYRNFSEGNIAGRVLT